MPDVAAQPYGYTFAPATTALLVIDMQRDFIEPGGFGEALGNDVSRLGAIVPAVRELIGWCRACGIRVIHQAGHARDGARPGRDRRLEGSVGGAARLAVVTVFR